MKSQYIIQNNGKDKKITIKNAKLRKDMYGYSLDMTYTIETPEEISELHIPRVMLPMSNKNIEIETESTCFGDSICTADIGFGSCRVLNNGEGRYFTIKTIETKTKEMTLEEIEKKLGHKVKIVNK